MSELVFENDVMKCLKDRGSVRAFEERDISDDLLNSVLDAGCRSATGGNLQPYSIIKIRSKEKKQALMDTNCMQSIVQHAPVNLLFVVDWYRTKTWAEANHAPYSVLDGYRHFWIGLQDTIIAAQSICTAADAVGLGSVYLGTVESCFDELKDMFDLPEGVFPVVILSLGYPKKKPEIAPKLMHDVIVHEERYQRPSVEAINKMMDKKYSDRANVPLSPKNLETLFEVTKNIDGEEAAQKAVDYAKELGFVHMAQRYFALHYSADWSRTGNGDFLNSLRRYGFTFVDGINHPDYKE